MIIRWACVAAVVCGTALCQDFRATLTGRVVDASNSPVPNVPVLARNTATNETTQATTGEQGAYTIPFLRPGSYDVTVELAGFKKFARSGLILNVGQAATLDVKLELGALTEQVTVTGEAPLLDVAKADRGAVIGTQQLAEFALNGRNAVMLSRLVPGVMFLGAIYAQGTTSQGAIERWSINGSQDRMTGFLLDGAPNDAKAYVNAIAYVPPAEAIQEFKIQSNSYDAQYGRTGGGIVNIAVKGGTNAFHGTAYEFARRVGWSANSFQNNAKSAGRSSFVYDQYGFQVEGPVYLPKLYNGRDKSFFMFAFEGIRSSSPSAILSSVPEPDMREGDFSKLVDANGRPITIYDPATGRDVNGVWTREAFPGNRIPANRINTIARNIVNFMPKPNTVTPGQGYSRLNYNVPGGDNPGTNHPDSIIFKLDQNIGDKHRVFFRGAWNDFNYKDSSNGIRGPGATGDFGETKINKAAVADWVGTITPTFIANLRLSFNYFRNDVFIRENYGVSLAERFGFPASVEQQLPITNWFGVYSFAGYISMGRYGDVNHTNNFSIQPNITTIRGSHTLKAGVDLRWVQWAVGNWGNPFSLAADAGWTQRDYTRADALSGNAIASFLLGTPSSGGSDFNALPFYSYKYMAPWIQDDWKVTRRLTLNLGLRWDFNLPPFERFNRLNRGFDYTSVNPVEQLIDRGRFPDLAPLRGGLRFAGVGGASRLAVDTDRNNVQPRFGAAFMVTDKLVLRGGWGRTYVNPQDYYGQTNGFSQNTPIITTLDGGRTPIANVINNPFPDGVLVPPGSSLGLATAVGRGFSVARTSFQIPYMDQFSFGFQYAMPWSSKLEVTYVGSRGRDLQASRSFNTYDLAFRQRCNLMEGGDPLYCDERLPNPFAGLGPFRGTTNFTATTLSRSSLASTYPHFGSLTEVNGNEARSWYNSMQVTWESRGKGGLNLLVSYTLSKQIEQNSYLDVQQNIMQRGLVDFDQPHRFTIGSIYELPFGRGKRWLNRQHGFWSRLLSGWENTTMFFYTSGRPWALPGNVLYLREAKLDNIDWSAPNVRAVMPCVARWNDNGSITMQPFSVSAGCTDYNFLITPRFAPRFTPLRDGRLRLHSVPQVDISLTKRTRITEKTSLQFRAEAFNATNTYSFYLQQFTNDPNSALFGSLNKDAVSRGNSNTPRSIQLGLKFLW